MGSGLSLGEKCSVPCKRKTSNHEQCSCWVNPASGAAERKICKDPALETLDSFSNTENNTNEYTKKHSDFFFCLG